MAAHPGLIELRQAHSVREEAAHLAPVFAENLPVPAAVLAGEGDLKVPKRDATKLRHDEKREPKEQREEHDPCALRQETEEEEEAPAPKAKAKKAKVEEVEAEEPVVRKEEKKPNAVPKAKSALADMVDDWDENE
mgnify:CR=1 FL=1